MHEPSHSDSALGLSLTASAALHALVLLALGGMTASALRPSDVATGMLKAVLVQAAASERIDAPARLPAATQVQATGLEAAERIAGKEVGASARPGILFDPPRYYSAHELDVRARPLTLGTAPRSERAELAHQLVHYRLDLFINEFGAIDRIEIIEPPGSQDVALLEDVKELRFHPAQRAGVPVKSRKRVELSFVR